MAKTFIHYLAGNENERPLPVPSVDFTALQNDSHGTDNDFQDAVEKKRQRVKKLRPEVLKVARSLKESLIEVHKKDVSSIPVR